MSDEDKDVEDIYIDLLGRFSSHEADEGGVIRMRLIRQSARLFAKTIDTLCPENREKATALTQLTFVMYSANASISNPYPIDVTEMDYDADSVPDMLNKKSTNLF